MSRIIAKKHLGQNFLVDPNVKKRILAACELAPGDTVLEIGPGLGALTDLIAPRVKTVYAVEKDRDLYDGLQKKFADQGQVRIIHQDFLNFDLSQLPEATKVVGNLPYNISTPILEKFLTEKHACRELFFTVQLEFGERLAAGPGTQQYGALTCFAQYFCDVRLLFKIPRTCFRPTPKVMSCFLKLNFRNPVKEANDPGQLFRIIRQAFQQRRKKITNALAAPLGTRCLEILDVLGIDANLRPENLELEDYIRISDLLGGP